MSPFPLVPRKNTTDEIVVHVPSEDEMKMLSEMFPSVESEAIKSVIEAIFIVVACYFVSFSIQKSILMV